MKTVRLFRVLVSLLKLSVPLLLIAFTCPTYAEFYVVNDGYVSCAEFHPGCGGTVHHYRHYYRHPRRHYCAHYSCHPSAASISIYYTWPTYPTCGCGDAWVGSCHSSCDPSVGITTQYMDTYSSEWAGSSDYGPDPDYDNRTGDDIYPDPSDND